MQAFITEATNRPGELARHTEAIARRGVNLASVVCLGYGDRGGAGFLATDVAGLRAALNDAGIAFREVPLVTIGIEDKPGTLADAARRLGDAGVNIEFLAPLGMSGQKVTVAIGVDRIEEANKALGNLITEWSGSPVGATAR